MPENPATPFTAAEATAMAGVDPDFHNRTLFNLIADTNQKEAALQADLKKVDKKLTGASPGEKEQLAKVKANLKQQIEELPYPRWRVNAHIIKPDEVEASEINIFDASKLLPKELGRTIEIGRITLNRNPRNQFAETEQSAFSVANIVPGWDISPDPSMLHLQVSFIIRSQATMLIDEQQSSNLACLPTAKPTATDWASTPISSP